MLFLYFSSSGSICPLQCVCRRQVLVVVLLPNCFAHTVPNVTVKSEQLQGNASSEKFLPIIPLRSLISPQHLAMGSRDGHGFNGSHTTTGRRPTSKGARGGTPAEGGKGRKCAHAARYACASFCSLCIPRVHIHATQTFLTRLLCGRQRDELRVGAHEPDLPEQGRAEADRVMSTHECSAHELMLRTPVL